jgi:hypothetical protein
MSVSWGWTNSLTEDRVGSPIEIGACDIEVGFTLELGHRAMLSSQHLFGCAK